MEAIITGDLFSNRLEGSTLENVHITSTELHRELSIESWSKSKLQCLFGSAGLKVIIT